MQLGDEVAVKVDDIDPNGKVSLSLVSADGATGSASSGGGSSGGGSSSGGDRDDDGESSDTGREYVSFEDSFDEEVRGEFGDLGPETPSGGGGGDRSGGGGRGGNRRGGGQRRRR